MLTFFINQKLTVFVNQYQVFDAAGDTPGKLVAYAQQKRLAIRELFSFYKDETKQTLQFQVKARDVLEIAATYDVTDADGTQLGYLRKEFRSSLFRSTWHVHGSQGDKPIAIVQERSMPLALFRRIWQFIPFIGDIPFLLKYHFDFIDPESGKVLGTYTKLTLWRDHYRLTIEDELAGKADWRVFVAQGVGLDALQSR